MLVLGSACRLGRAVLALAIAVLLLGSFALLPSATAATSVTVRGTFVFDTWSLDCILRPDGVYKCVGTGSGPFYGGITGEFSISVKDVFTPPVSPFYAAEAKGTIVCDPCTVAGLSGSITFSVAWTTTHTGKVTGTLEVKSAGGQLAGLSGAGSMWATAASASNNYALELTLPS